MSKRKKLKKSEKAKIKFKDSKLRKGLNVTKTDFKVKKIIIKEQILDVEPEVSDTVQKHNIQEIIRKLQNNKNASRIEGIRHLKEMFMHYPNIIKLELRSLLTNVSQLCMDIEMDIRRDGIKALSIIISKLSSTTCLLPFTGILTSYLNCAMTHIKLTIQEDSLFILDIFLTYLPNMIVEYCDKIFPLFMDMISRLRKESEPDRTLKLNLTSKITSVNWRSKVLDRLLSMIKILYNSRVKDFLKTNVNNTPLFTDKQRMDHLKTITVYHNKNERQHFSLVRSHYNQNCPIPNLFKSDPTSSQSFSHLPESKRLQTYSELLMPLLFETWIEIRPNDYGKDNVEKLIVPTQIAASLKTILEIISYLCELISLHDTEMRNDLLKDWFYKQYNKNFVLNFLKSYPYYQESGFKGKKRDAKGRPTEQEVSDAGSEECFHQNFTIAFIFSTLNKKNITNYLSAAQEILKFLTRHLENITFISSLTDTSEMTKLIEKVLKIILINNGRAWSKVNNQTKGLLGIILKNSEENKFPKEIRTKIILLLCSIIVDYRENVYTFYGKEIFSSWILTLPKLLCHPFIHYNVIEAFSFFGSQKNYIFLNALENNLFDVIRNLDKLTIFGHFDENLAKYQILYLLYWLKNWNSIDLLAVNDKLSDDLVKVIKQMECVRDDRLKKEQFITDNYQAMESIDVET